MRFGSVCSGIEAASVESVKPFQESAAKLPEGMRVKAATRDIAGERFGRLVAQHVVGKSKRNSLVWLCKCDCGQAVERTSAGLRKSKGVSSCGCYLKEFSKEWLASVEPWNKGKSYAGDSGVRRLTPEECEALQGFPRGYTAITIKGKPAADGPRYRALGNSMAVPCMHWIGKRISQHLNNKGEN
jgi:site-specific DNA-cytosine methylase